MENQAPHNNPIDPYLLSPPDPPSGSRVNSLKGGYMGDHFGFEVSGLGVMEKKVKTSIL